MNERDAILCALTHAENTSRADRETCFFHTIDRFDTVIISSCCDDLRIKFSRGIEIVIIGVKSCIFQFYCLLLSQHPECTAYLDSKGGDLCDTLENGVKSFSITHLSPCSANADAGGACSNRSYGRIDKLLNLQRRQRRNFRFVMGGLRAVFAIFGTPSCLKRNECTALYFTYGMMPLMDSMSIRNE